MENIIATTSINQVNIESVLPQSTTSVKHHRPCQHCASRKTCKICHLLQNIPIHQQQSFFRSHNITKHRHLFYAGDSLSTLYVIKSGFFKTYLGSETGDEQVTGFYMAGDVLGADALINSQHSLCAEALESSTVCAISINQLETAARRYSPNWLVKLVYDEVIHERHIYQIRARKNCADARIALFLLDLSNRYKSRGYSDREFQMNIPHRDIAYYLDMALETVSRVFSRLQEKGILAIEKRLVTIKDREQLQALTQIRPLAKSAIS